MDDISVDFAHDRDDVTDMELVDRARGGDRQAFARLFARHKHSAGHVARRVMPHGDVDDIVAESFVRVLQQISEGKGPRDAFRAYLLTAVRHEAIRQLKRSQRTRATDDLMILDQPVDFGEGRVDAFEGDAVRAAYQSLPERWRLVLWQLDVEGRRPSEIAEQLDLAPNTVSALAYRARAALREAYLGQHVKQVETGGDRLCRVLRPKLAALVRGSLSSRQRERATRHLEDCDDCGGVYRELVEVNTHVGALLTPLAPLGVAVLSPQAGGATAVFGKIIGGIQAAGAAVAQPVGIAVAATAVVMASVAPSAVVPPHRAEAAPARPAETVISEPGPLVHARKEVKSEPSSPPVSVKDSSTAADPAGDAARDARSQGTPADRTTSAGADDPTGTPNTVTSTGTGSGGGGKPSYLPAVGDDFGKDATITDVKDGGSVTTTETTPLSGTTPTTDAQGTVVYHSQRVETTTWQYTVIAQPTDEGKRSYEKCGATMQTGGRYAHTVIRRTTYHDGILTLVDGTTRPVSMIVDVSEDVSIDGVPLDAPAVCAEEGPEEKPEEEPEEEPEGSEPPPHESPDAETS